jgi:hypothetical protein
MHHKPLMMHELNSCSYEGFRSARSTPRRVVAGDLSRRSTHEGELAKKGWPFSAPAPSLLAQLRRA